MFVWSAVKAKEQAKKQAKQDEENAKERKRRKSIKSCKNAKNLKDFEEKYAKLQTYGDGGKDWTSIAQYTSSLNRRNSEELKFYMWSVLAIVLIITVISNFKKKAV